MRSRTANTQNINRALAGSASFDILPQNGGYATLAFFIAGALVFHLRFSFTSAAAVTFVEMVDFTFGSSSRLLVDYALGSGLQVYDSGTTVRILNQLWSSPTVNIVGTVTYF